MRAATTLWDIARVKLGFQSTPPVRAATYTKDPMEITEPISIHAACEGGDAATGGARSIP